MEVMNYWMKMTSVKETSAGQKRTKIYAELLHTPVMIMGISFALAKEMKDQ
jgi:hypothetical protein